MTAPKAESTIVSETGRAQKSRSICPSLKIDAII
jgi:hypothetical protein